MSHKILLLCLFLFAGITTCLAGPPIDFSFKNPQDGTLLSASLEEPIGPYQKIVIIIPGSGADDRTTHPKLTAHLLEKGIAVCRFDDRGTGKSKGKFKDATTLDFAYDLIGLFDYLRTSEAYAEMQIGFLGHDEGGLIALTALSKEAAPAFIVLLGTPGMSCKRIIFGQTESSLNSQWRFGDEVPQVTRKHLIEIHRILQKDLSTKVTKKEIKLYFKEQDIKYKPKKFLSPHYRYYIDMDPTETLRFLTVPTLYLVGKDDQYIQAKQNIKKIWATGNSYIEYESIPGLQHYLQPQGAPIYDMSPIAMERISTWLEKQ